MVFWILGCLQEIKLQVTCTYIYVVCASWVYKLTSKYVEIADTPNPPPREGEIVYEAKKRLQFLNDEV